MHRLLALATALVTAGALAVAASAGDHHVDPAGDSGAAPDITSVDVSNDGAGTITFTAGIVSHAAIAPDESFDVFVDSDRNPATGDSGGADYVVDLTQSGWGLFHWSGSQFTQVTTHGTITVSYLPTSWTVKINKVDLGGVATFDFWAATSKGPGDASDAFDVAPDGADIYTYTLTAASVSSVVIGFKPASAVGGVHPGARFSIGSAGVKLSDGTLADASSVTCKASIGGKPIPASGSCSWKVPKSAAGKTIVVVVTVRYQGKAYPVKIPVKVLKT